MGNLFACLYGSNGCQLHIVLRLGDRKSHCLRTIFKRIAATEWNSNHLDVSVVKISYMGIGWSIDDSMAFKASVQSCITILPGAVNRQHEFLRTLRGFQSIKLGDNQETFGRETWQWQTYMFTMELSSFFKTRDLLICSSVYVPPSQKRRFPLFLIILVCVT